MGDPTVDKFVFLINFTITSFPTDTSQHRNAQIALIVLLNGDTVGE